MWRQLPLALILGSTLACSSTGDAGPRLAAIDPAASTYGASLAVTLRGEGFRPAVAVRFDGHPGGVNVHFRAWIGGIELTEVTYIDDRSLRATTPALLPLGLHTVELRDPDGRDAALASAFLVRESGSDGGGGDPGPRPPGDDAPGDATPICEPACAASCVMECAQGGGGCYCASGCPCLLTCPADDCAAICLGRGTSCDVDWRGSDDNDLGCFNAACTVDLRDSHRARVDCGLDADCVVDCSGSDDCDVDCHGAASCRVECAGATGCRIDTCVGERRTCGTALTCNREC